MSHPTAPASSQEEARRKALEERAQKRALLLVASLRKFIKAYAQGCAADLAARTAAEAAKGSKKGRKSKTKDPEPKQGKDGKSKKPVESPTVLAWKALFAELDDKINKQKRCKCEDLCGAVLVLEEQECKDLAAILAVVSPKTFKTFNWNEPSMMIKCALFSAVSSWEYVQPKACSMERLGLTRFVRVVDPLLVKKKGCELHQFLDTYSIRDASAAGYPCREVAAAGSSVAALREAGFSVQEAVDCSVFGLEGARGVSSLLSAGYSLKDIHASKRFCLVDYQQAGCSKQEVMEHVRCTKEEFAAAGFAPPLAQPAEPLGRATRCLKLNLGRDREEGPILWDARPKAPPAPDPEPLLAAGILQASTNSRASARSAGSFTAQSTGIGARSSLVAQAGLERGPPAALSTKDNSNKSASRPSGAGMRHLESMSWTMDHLFA